MSFITRKEEGEKVLVAEFSQAVARSHRKLTCIINPSQYYKLVLCSQDHQFKAIYEQLGAEKHKQCYVRHRLLCLLLHLYVFKHQNSFTKACGIIGASTVNVKQQFYLHLGKILVKHLLKAELSPSMAHRLCASVTLNSR